MQTKHPITATDTSKKVLRARLSLQETQTEFAARFMVSRITIHNWESGKSMRMQPIHKKILDSITNKLNAEGRLMSNEIFVTVYREQVVQRGLNDRYHLV